jgi:hypothetical protein
MSSPVLQLIDGDAGGSLAELKESFGIVDKPIDTPIRRLHTWALVAIGGSINMVRVGEVIYSWDTKPRLQKNGAVIGRVHAQRRGEGTRDIGSYKIDAAGQVVHLPEALRAILPGGATASTANEGEDNVQC